MNVPLSDLGVDVRTTRLECQQRVEFAFRDSYDIPNSPPELMSESPGFLLVEFCKGHTSISHDNSAEIQEEKLCPIAVDFSRD